MPVDLEELRGKFFSVEEAAECLGMCIDSIRRKIRAGHVAARKPPGARAYVVTGEALIEYLVGAAPNGKKNERKG